MSVTKEQAVAYTEVIEILKHVEKIYVDKIPSKLIQYYEQNKDYNYKFNLDKNKEFEEQNLTPKTKTVLAILFKNYWATDKQKEKIDRKQAYDLEIIEQEKKKKYSYDNLFRKEDNLRTLSNLEIENKSNQMNKMIEYKESIFKKFINKIKNLLHLR